jgi:hypothetical protein
MLPDRLGGFIMGALGVFVRRKSIFSEAIHKTNGAQTAKLAGPYHPKR